MWDRVAAGVGLREQVWVLSCVLWGWVAVGVGLREQGWVLSCVVLGWVGSGGSTDGAERTGLGRAVLCGAGWQLSRS